MTLNEQIELLQAIGAGKTVQFTLSGLNWCDMHFDKRSSIIFDPAVGYRIKPEPKTVWVKSYSVCYSTPECLDGWTKFMEVME